MKLSHLRNHKCLLAWSLFCLAGMFCFAADKPEAADLTPFYPDLNCFSIGDGIIVGTPDFTGNPRWVVWETREENLDGPGDRQLSHWHVSFAALPERTVGSVDYEHSGMSKGHLSPAADHTRSQKAIDCTHDYANCVLQNQEQNAGVWERLEERRRDIRRAGEQVISTVVPIYFDHTQEPGATDLGGKTWKVHTVAHGPHFVFEPVALAASIRIGEGKHVRLENYLIPNKASVAKKPLEDFRVACDLIEGLANLDLWPHQDEKLEKNP